MQYLLSDLEYKKLVADSERQNAVALYTLQDLCTKVADHMPVKFWGRKKAEPWGCILTKPDHYCDECPVSDACPHRAKRWSK